MWEVMEKEIMLPKNIKWQYWLFTYIKEVYEILIKLLSEESVISLQKNEEELKIFWDQHHNF